MLLSWQQKLDLFFYSIETQNSIRNKVVFLVVCGCSRLLTGLFDVNAEHVLSLRFSKKKRNKKSKKKLEICSFHVALILLA